MVAGGKARASTTPATTTDSLGLRPESYLKNPVVWRCGVKTLLALRILALDLLYETPFHDLHDTSCMNLCCRPAVGTFDVHELP